MGEAVHDFIDGDFSSAPGVDTITVFPKNGAKCKNLLYSCIHSTFFKYCTGMALGSAQELIVLYAAFSVIPAGEETELLVGVKNDGN